jgi:1,4-alpha-glucan branching enzyme
MPQPTAEQLLTRLHSGRDSRLHDVMGAHPDANGVQFRVYAPHAQRVSVIGDFNHWQHDTMLGEHGMFSLHHTAARVGHCYKFHVVGRDGVGVDKADPFARRSELPPKTASVVEAPSAYAWQDAGWMASRGKKSAMSIYEVHLGSWRRRDDGSWLSYREVAPLLADYVAKLGFTHVELLPVSEHPFYGSWGYQVSGYFAPTARFGSPDDLRFLIDALHQRGVGVLLDWVPAHFPHDGFSLFRFDGTPLFEHGDDRRGYHPDWRSAIFNYGSYFVRNFLVSSACAWLSDYHVDGLRVDGVASMLYHDYSRKAGEWLPNEHGGREHYEAIDFLRIFNEEVHSRFPDAVTIAEESTAFPKVTHPTTEGGLGFDFKWDMGWMHDTLQYLKRDPVHRRHHHNELTFRAVYASSERFVLALSHDEVVHEKGAFAFKAPGDEWQRLASLRLLFAYQWLLPGEKLLFMGGEFGADGEWNHERSLNWSLLQRPLHRGLSDLVAELGRLLASTPALSGDRFEWIDADDASQSVLSFLRPGKQPVLAVFNFTPVVRHHYRVGVPAGFASWKERLNTDAQEYGGSGVGNLGEAKVHQHGHHQRPESLVLTLPPLGAVILVGA